MKSPHSKHVFKKRFQQIFLIIYIVMTLGFFSFILGTQRIKGAKLNMYISDLANLGKLNPALGFAITMIIFSMVGLPPLAGFFGKMYLFLAAMQSELYSLAIIGVLSSVVAAFYYIRIIKVMYFDTSNTYSAYKELDTVNALVLSASLGFLMFFFAYPHPLSHLSYLYQYTPVLIYQHEIQHLHLFLLLIFLYHLYL